MLGGDTEKSTTDELTTIVEHKRHFLTLDGLRAVAAISVVLFHRRWWSPTGHFLDHAYLAVDFFFVLSGFVIGYAYDRSLQSGELSARRFVVIRLIRLYPLVVFGALIGATALLYSAIHHSADMTVTRVIELLPLAALALPVPASLATTPYPFNGPTWSLTCEIGANIVYAVLAKWLKTPILVAIAFISLIIEVFAVHSAGTLSVIGSHFGPILPEVARVTFPFTVGILIYRLHLADRLPRLPFGFVTLSLVTVVSFVPDSTIPHSSVYDLFCVAVLYPLIVVAGCGHEPKGGRLRAIAKWGANISYPIYAVHYPLLMWLDTALTHFGVGGRLRFALFIVFVGGLILICTYISRADAAVRRAVSRVLLRLPRWPALGSNAETPPS